MSVFLFLRRFSKLIIFSIGLVLFFLSYNIFLVDRSIIDLKTALAEASDVKTISDFQRIKSVLKMPIFNQITSKDVSSRGLASLELADNIAGSDNINSSPSLRFYLKEAVRIKEAQRPGVLSFFDNLNVFFFKTTNTPDEKGIQAMIRVVQSKLSVIKDSAQLQDLHYELAGNYIKLGNYVQAEAELLKVINIDPLARISVKSRFNLGWIYKISGDAQKAIGYFSDLAQEFSGKDDDFAIVCRYQIADVLYKQGDFLGARDYYAKLTNDYPEFKATDFGLLEAGNISFYNLKDAKIASAFLGAFDLYQSGKNFSSIVADAVEEIENRNKPAELPEELPVEEEAVVKEQKVEEIEKLREDFFDALAVSELKKKGFQLLRDGKYAEAVDTFNKVLEAFPNDGVTHSGLSLGLFWLKDRRALREAKLAVEFAPSNELVAVNTMFVLIKSKLPKEAIVVAQNFLMQRSGAVKKAELYYNLGYAYTMIGKMEEAITYFRYAIRLNSDYIFAINNLGAILWSQRKFPDAIRMIKEAIAVSPKYADAHFNLGAIYFNTGRLEEALHEFQLVLDIDPGYKEVIRYIDMTNKRLSRW